MGAFLIVLLAALTASPAAAETLVAARTLRAQTVIGPDDVARIGTVTPGALRRAADAVGLEARVNLYAGRPIHPNDLGPPALIDRNEIVTLNYYGAGVAISTDARALDRGGVGEAIRVMNLGSRNTVVGRVMTDGSVAVVSN